MLPLLVFQFFSSIPPEVRETIWEFAADFSMVVISYDERSIRRLSHPLMHACSESRLVYLKQFRDNLDFKIHNQSINRAQVNFRSDYFYLRGFSPYYFIYPARASLEQMQNIVLDGYTLDADMLERALFGFRKLKHLRVTFTDGLKQFCPTPIAQLQRQCNLHHCNELPNKYVSLGTPAPMLARGREICPVCLWEVEMFGRPISPNNFRLMLDPALPKRPTRIEFLETTNPTLTWVRVAEENWTSDEDGSNEGDEWPDEELRAWAATAKACLTSNVLNCSH
ncbi:hypothetical protein F4802DRAFT_591117 [Xylaria palmicola]|nr:hypothetical protein F4802DRAFT_591117 [Xylaria palmicola]